MRHILILSAGLCAAWLSTPCTAQNSDYENAMRGQNMEARIGVTIPFGGDGKSTKRKPQLEFIGRRSGSNQRSIDWAMKPEHDRNEFVETRLALTLTDTPELRLNDHPLYSFETDSAEVSDGVKTAGKVALGAGLITLAAAVVFVGVLAITYESDYE